MCGIVGWITSERKLHESDRSKFLRQGLIIDTLRGDDSTGAFAVGHEPLFEGGEAYWAKQVGAGHAFTESTNYWESLYDTQDYRAMVGHNRAATMGKVNTSGAHPFSVGPITLVHNGTLRSTHVLPTPMHQCMVPTGDEGKERKIEVDSHAIAYNLAHHDVADVIGKLRGAFALVWHDARDDSVNIIRNDERPLHMAMSKNDDTLYFMSEGAMLHMLDTRLKLGLSGIYYPKAGQLLRWLPDTPLDAPEVKNLDLDDGGQYWRGQGYDRYGGYDWDDDDATDGYNGLGSTAMSGNGLAPHASADWVFVGGRRKEVPMLIQEVMLKYDLVTEDRLHFKPLSNERNVQYGLLDGKYKAMLLNSTPGTGPHADRAWKVRPVSVQVTAAGEPLVTCKLVSTIWSGSTPTNSDGDTRIMGGVPYVKRNDVWVPESNVLQDALGRSIMGYPDEEDRVRGPGGSRISCDEFKRRCVDGCIVCTSPIDVSDADDITWTADGNEVLCDRCDEETYYHMYGGRVIH